MGNLIVRSPVTGKEIAYATPEPGQVQAVVEKARTAFQSWGKTSLPERLSLVRKIRNTVVDELDQTVAAVTHATGKVDMEVLVGDVLTCLDMMYYYEKHAADILKPKKRRKDHILFPGSKFYVQYSPIGVVAVISPWNYPLQLALVPIISALVAGNTVVLKPSEVTPSIGELIESLCRKVSLPEGVVQVVYGDGQVGQELIRARPDKIFFTGSVATGKKIMAAAAAELIPVELELGGKDPMIVFEDAHFERAVSGAIYGAFANAGQVCVSVERLYVQQSIYERFVTTLTEKVHDIRVGMGRNADVGAIISPIQKQIVEARVKDAVEKGAILTTDNKCEGNFYHPVILHNVNHAMDVMKHETFGPVLPVMPFTTEEEAVTLANDTLYGLNASVWTRDLKKARRVADRLITGNCAINDVVKNICNSDMPFGGEKQSGLGRYHGPEGLYAFSRQKSVMVNAGRGKRELNWFPYGPDTYGLVQNIIYFKYRNQGLWQKVKQACALLKSAIRQLTIHKK